MKLPIRHQPAKSDVEHERNFWCWKYERREAECEELADRLGDLQSACKQWRQATESRLRLVSNREMSDCILPPDAALFEAIDRAGHTDQEGGPLK